jgi:hypothetical protein
MERGSRKRTVDCTVKIANPLFIGPSLVVLLGALWAGAALAQVFRCESESGGPLYQSTAEGRNCRPLDLAPLTTIPAPRLPAAAAPKPPAAAGAPAVPNAAPPAVGAVPGAGFPRVDTSTQRVRDGERRVILEAELRKEEDRLESLRREFNNGEPERVGGERNYQKYLDRVERLKEDIGRSEANIGALRRELSAIRE